MYRVVNNLPWEGANQKNLEWLFTFEGVWVKPASMWWGPHAYAFEGLFVSFKSNERNCPPKCGIMCMSA